MRAKHDAGWLSLDSDFNGVNSLTGSSESSCGGNWVGPAFRPWLRARNFILRVWRAHREGDDKKTHREETTMDINEKLDALRSGHLSRRDFNKTLSASGSRST